MSADTQGDRMSDIERCWTVFIDTFGRAFDVEDGVSPHAGATARDGSEVVAVVPAEQLRGAVTESKRLAAWLGHLTDSDDGLTRVAARDALRGLAAPGGQ